MLADLYVEAFKVDMDLADQVWELWNAGVITDEIATWAWWVIITSSIGARFREPLL